MEEEILEMLALNFPKKDNADKTTKIVEENKIQSDSLND